MKNKLILFALLLALVLPGAAYAQSGAQEGGASYDATLLTALGLTDHDALAENAAVTARRAAQAAAWLINLNVPEGQSALDVLGRMGYLSAADPEAEVTYAQAAKLMVDVLGYTYLASAGGGSAEAYLSAAASAGILNGIPAGSKMDEVTFGKLLLNTLKTDIAKQTAYGQEVKYETKRDVNLLSEYHQIYKSRGRVEANEDTAVSYPSGTGEGLVRIGTVDYEAGGSGAGAMLGMDVDFYWQDMDGDTPQVICAMSRMGADSVLMIEDADVDAADFRQVTYLDQGRRRTVKLSPVADLVFNGRSLKSSDARLLRPDSGSLTLLDSDGDGSYDVIKVTSYVNYIVESVDRENKTVYGKYGKPALELDDTAVKCRGSRKDGAAFSLDGLREWTVLAVAADRVTYGADGMMRVDTETATLYTMTATEEQVDGTVRELGEDTLTVAGKQYEIGHDAAANSKNGIRMGMTGVFFLDVNGKICGVDEITDFYREAGYVIELGTHSAMDATVQMKVLTQQGTIEILELAEKVELDGEGGTLAKAALQKLSATGSGGQQMIGYELNENGKVKLVDTTAVGPNEDPETSLTLDLAAVDKEYTKNARAFEGVYMLGSGCKVFQVNATYTTDEDSFSVKDENSLSDNRNYTLDVYNLSKAKTTRLVVRKGNFAAESVDQEAALLLVDRMVRAQGEDGSNVWKIYGMMEGKMQGFICSPDVKAREAVKRQKDEVVPELPLEMNDVERGDVLRIAHNLKEEVVTVERVFDRRNSKQNNAPRAFEKELYYPSYDGYRTIFLVNYGWAYMEDDGNLMVSFDNGGALPSLEGEYLCFNIKTANIRFAKYDSKSDTISAAKREDLVTYETVTDVEKASKVLIYTRYGVVRDVIIMD